MGIRLRRSRNGGQQQAEQSMSRQSHRPSLPAPPREENEPNGAVYNGSSPSSAAFAAARIISGPLFRMLPTFGLASKAAADRAAGALFLLYPATGRSRVSAE